MRLPSLIAALALLAATGPVTPAAAASSDAMPLYLLFVNTSTAPLIVKSMTLEGGSCADCKGRTLAPGESATVPIGLMAGKHLTIVMASAGGRDVTYKSDSQGTSLEGMTSRTVKISFAGADRMFGDKGTPRFTVIYAYDAAKRP
jgi:hypothetical protein